MERNDSGFMEVLNSLLGSCQSPKPEYFGSGDDSNPLYIVRCKAKLFESSDVWGSFDLEYLDASGVSKAFDFASVFSDRLLIHSVSRLF